MGYLELPTGLDEASVAMMQTLRHYLARRAVRSFRLPSEAYDANHRDAVIDSGEVLGKALGKYGADKGKDVCSMGIAWRSRWPAGSYKNL